MKFASLRSLLQGLQLSDQPDDRRLADDRAFSSRAAYVVLSYQVHDKLMDMIWVAFVPQKVKIFGWLFMLNSLNTRLNPIKKNIV